MTISYKDYNEEDARAKLNALVKTVEKFSNEMVEVKTVDQNGNEIVKYEKMFFKANISIVPMYEAECLRGSDTKKIVIIVSGEDKAEIVNKAFFGPVTPQVPASILQFHPDVCLVADAAALSKSPF